MDILEMMTMHITSLLSAPVPEIDYTYLMHVLSKYRKPRDVVTRLIRQQEIIRIKKGLYVLGAERRKRSVSKEVLANLIYGPSYVSLDSALALYGLIPEGVFEMTSVTRNRKKHFVTPLGRFTYQHLPARLYSCGVQLRSIDEVRSFLIATPEKALVEKIRFLGTAQGGTMESLLRDDLRVDFAGFNRFSIGRLQRLVSLFGLPGGDELVALVTEAKAECRRGE